MIKEIKYRCPKCAFMDIVSRYYWRCPRRGSPLEINYKAVWNPSGNGLVRYSTSLPFTPPKSLGEGGTPLIEIKYRGVRVKFKLEYLNPTGSFKDRGTSLAISLAFLLGYRRVVEDTSGNTGISVAAYSRLYDLKTTIVMPAYAPKGKKILIKALGADIIETPTRDDAARKVLELIDSRTYYVAHTYNPLYIEGAKTIIYEAWEQGFNGNIVIVPVGSGGLFLGIYKGLRDLIEWGLIRKMPRIIAVEGASTVRLCTRINVSHDLVEGESKLANGIMVSNPPRLTEILDALKNTRGDVIVVNDADIVQALKELLDYGLIVEPTSATAFAALKKLIKQKKIQKDDEVLIPLTGSGLKMIDLFEKIL